MRRGRGLIKVSWLCTTEQSADFFFQFANSLSVGFMEVIFFLGDPIS
jgi:hypothetical protein